VLESHLCAARVVARFYRSGSFSENTYKYLRRSLVAMAKPAILWWTASSPPTLTPTAVQRSMRLHRLLPPQGLGLNVARHIVAGRDAL
jgi:hypothetical protein